MRVWKFLATSLLLAAAGCFRTTPTSGASPIALKCAAPMTPHLRTRIHFDRSNATDPPYNTYSELEWERFITEVLVRFIPAGGSIFENTGWWRRPNGTTFRGIGRTLVVWAPAADSARHRAGADSVIAQIKQRYHHQVVFREEEPVCEAAH